MEKNDKEYKFEVADHVTIPKYKNAFQKNYSRNQFEEIFMIKNVKNSEHVTYITEDVYEEENYGTLYEKELQKRNQTNRKNIKQKK